MNMLNEMYGSIAPGLCRLSMSGGIAVKTSNGYKSYNLKTGRLTNCDSFCFDIGEEFFFVIPTNHVNVGDIILVNKKPKCVKKVEKDEITVINYEDSTIETILPERHVFMGNTYFYGKIVSMFGSDLKGKGMKNMMKYMAMSKMMKTMGNQNMGNGNPEMSMFFMAMAMNGDGNSIFDDMFGGFLDEEEETTVKNKNVIENDNEEEEA